MNKYHKPFVNVNVNVHYAHIIISLRDDLTPVESSPLGERERDDNALLWPGGPILWAPVEGK